MSLINKQNIKALALEIAKTYDPEKTRIGAEFITQIEDLVGCVVVQQVIDQISSAKTLTSTEWGDQTIRKAKLTFTKLDFDRYLRDS